MRKVFVEVTAKYDISGNIRPLSLLWEDGRTFEIDRILDIRPAASLKVGGSGMRYTCNILGKPAYLFLDNNQWFVEGK